MSHPQSETVEKGIASARAGHRLLSRLNFARAAESEPDNDVIWTWLGWVAESPSAAVGHLERALSCNPENEVARAGLLWAKVMAEFDFAYPMGARETLEAVALRETVMPPPRRRATVAPLSGSSFATGFTIETAPSAATETAADPIAAALSSPPEAPAASPHWSALFEKLQTPAAEAPPAPPEPIESPAPESFVAAEPAAPEAPPSPPVLVAPVAETPNVESPKTADAEPADDYKFNSAYESQPAIEVSGNLFTPDDSMASFGKVVLKRIPAGDTVYPHSHAGFELDSATFASPGVREDLMSKSFTDAQVVGVYADNLDESGRAKEADRAPEETQALVSEPDLALVERESMFAPPGDSNQGVTIDPAHFYGGLAESAFDTPVEKKAFSAPPPAEPNPFKEAIAEAKAQEAAPPKPAEKPKSSLPTEEAFADFGADGDLASPALKTFGFGPGITQDSLMSSDFIDITDGITPSQADVIMKTVKAAEAKREQESAWKEGSSKRRILVVDDSPTVCKIVSMALKKHGFDVDTAGDGVEAMSLIESTHPDLILLDITMPRMDGYQLCKLIKGYPSTKQIPVIMLSGKDGFFDRVRGKLVGAADYITKPFDPEHLVATVERFLPAVAPAAVG